MAISHNMGENMGYMRIRELRKEAGLTQVAFVDEDAEQPEDGEDPPQAAGTGAEA